MSKPEVEARSRHLIVSPHVDDAWFSLGGSIAAWREAGDAVEVLNVFSTQAWTVWGNLPARFTSWLRKAEESRNAAALGVLLAYLDVRESHLRGYKLFFPQPVNWQRDERVFEMVLAALERQWPDPGPETCRYFPLGVGGHVDHQLLCRVGEVLLERRDGSSGRIAFYEDLPYVARCALCTDFIESHHLTARTTDIDVPGKLAMVRRHRSQLSRHVVNDIRLYALSLSAQAGAERVWLSET